MADSELFSALVKQLTHAMALEFDRHLKGHNVTLAQWGVLRHLWEHEGRSHVELQTLLRLEGATVTGLLQRMERAGLVQGRVDPADKRVQRVFLTEQGRALEPIVKHLAEDINQRALAGFTPDERDFLMRLLTRALQNIARE